jgi:hypothetical protein
MSHLYSFMSQVTVIESYQKQKNTKSYMTAVAISMLLCDVPIQVPANEGVVAVLCDMALEPLQKQKTNKKYSLSVEDEKKQRPYKLKTGGPTTTRTNIWFSDVLGHVFRTRRAMLKRFEDLTIYTGSLYNDQAAAWFMLAIALDGIINEPEEVALRIILDPSGSKNLTSVLKGTGLNSSRLGAILCEGNCLQGRLSLNENDLLAGCKSRLGLDGRIATPDLFSDDELREAIIEVLAKEIDLERYKPISDEKFWDTRWAWCANGAHSRVLEHHDPKHHIKYKGRAHRRVAAEEWVNNPVPNWDGRIYVSASNKFELGKNRLLLACDTVSYFAFEQLLRPVERCWRGERVLLDPGSGGHAGMADRVRSLRGRINVMLDYDDFNSQHTLRAQELVIDELCKFIGYDKERASMLVRSFSRMMITFKGRDLGFASSTLMSGHRGTTFLNSVLNAAYIRCAVGRALYNSFQSLHTGDDVVGRFDSYSQVTTLLSALKARRLRMNPMKQSVGTVSAEFLRMAIAPNRTVGYLCRAIGSSIAGSWDSDKELGPVERLSSAIGVAHTLYNRSFGREYARIVLPAVQRTTMLKRSKLTSILERKVAVGTGPVFSQTDYLWHGYPLARSVEEDDDTTPTEVNATTDYLSKAISPVEAVALQLTGVSVVNTMSRASYAKSEAGNTGTIRKVGVLLGRLGSHKTNYNLSFKAARSIKVREGALVKYPILQLIKERLNNAVIALLLDMIGEYRHDIPIRELAWGAQASGNVIVGWSSYADAAALSRHVHECVIVAGTPVLV